MVHVVQGGILDTELNICPVIEKMRDVMRESDPWRICLSLEFLSLFDTWCHRHRETVRSRPRGPDSASPRKSIFRRSRRHQRHQNVLGTCSEHARLAAASMYVASRYAVIFASRN